ncbi:hypothetical protein JNUCC23_09610 [Peribacillus sp. JNUCC 23]
MENILLSILLCIILFFLLINLFDRYLGLQLSASILGLFRLHNNELELLKRAVTKKKYKKYKADIVYCIGLKYSKLEQYDEAAKYFLECFKETNIFFKKEYNLVLKTFVLANQIEEGREIFNLFLEKGKSEVKYNTITKEYKLYYN